MVNCIKEGRLLNGHIRQDYAEDCVTVFLGSLIHSDDIITDFHRTLQESHRIFRAHSMHGFLQKISILVGTHIEKHVYVGTRGIFHTKSRSLT
jgi:hypothetical protein